MIEDSTPAAAPPADPAFENRLRPQKLSEFIGHESLKKNIGIIIEAAKSRGEPVGHTLFFGPAGVGKTTLAGLIAAETGGALSVSSGPALEKAGDIAALFAKLPPGGVLFIDEIHRLKKNVEEVLYTAMEDAAVDVILGAGPTATTSRIQLPPATLVGATTQPARLSASLRDRFQSSFRVEPYPDDAIAAICRQSAAWLQLPLSESAAAALARASRGVPRVANRLLKWVRDCAAVEKVGAIEPPFVAASLSKIGLDERGLDALDRAFLRALAGSFAGGPAGLATLAAALNEAESTLEEVVEPFLLRLGFIERTPNGRRLTPAGRAALSAAGV